MAQIVKLKAHKRTDKDQGNNFIPAVVYGPGFMDGKTSLPISLVTGEFLRVYRSAGTSTLIDLHIDDEQYEVLIHDYQLHPVKDQILHVDFLATKRGEKITATVPIKFIGMSPAVKLGGILNTPVDELEVKVLPRDLVHEFEIDISKLVNFGDHLTVADLNLNIEKFEVSIPLDTPIASVAAPKEEKEETPVATTEGQAMPEITAQKSDEEVAAEDKKE